jgi:hypothetical protein
MPARHALEESDRFRRVLDRIDAVRGVRRVPGEPARGTAIRLLALVRDHRAHLRRLADDACVRARARTHNVGDQAPDAKTTNFFIVGERKMEWRFQPPLHELRHQRQHAGDEALHIASAAAVEPAVLLGHLERIGIPRLPFHRHDVGMPGQNDARPAARTQRREQVGLALLVVVGQPDIGVVRLQGVADKMYQLEIGVAAHRWKRNELAQHLDA